MITENMFSIRSSAKRLSNLKGRVGRPQTNLLDAIKSDLKKRGLELQDNENLETIKELALDKAVWEAMYLNVE